MARQMDFCLKNILDEAWLNMQTSPPRSSNNTVALNWLKNHWRDPEFWLFFKIPRLLPEINTMGLTLFLIQIEWVTGWSFISGGFGQEQLDIHRRNKKQPWRDSWTMYIRWKKDLEEWGLVKGILVEMDGKKKDWYYTAMADIFLVTGFVEASL